MTTYPFRAAWYDYGLRASNRPLLGLMYHMAEGGGTVSYLDKIGTAPARGVSVHIVIEYTGRIVQMLPWSHVAGSLNPADRSTDKAYYGHPELVAVLGSSWPDPNPSTLQVEIEGFEAKGPNPAQVVAAVSWGKEMRHKFPTIRGALGHADQTDTKHCPGTTPAMKSIFTQLGGHGRWSTTVPTPPEAVMQSFQAPLDQLATLKTGAWLYDNSELTASPDNVQLDPGRDLPLVGIIGATSKIVRYSNGRAYWVKAADVTGIKPEPPVVAVPDPVIIAKERAAEHALVKAAAIKCAEAL